MPSSISVETKEKMSLSQILATYSKSSPINPAVLGNGDSAPLTAPDVGEEFPRLP